MFVSDQHLKLFSQMDLKLPIRIILVDDHHIVLDGLKSLLESDSDFLIVASLRSAEEALRAIKNDTPDILLTDYSLPEMSGLELFKLLKPNYPQLKVAIL